MAHGLDKHRSRENRKRVRAVLMEQWDPIGGSEFPSASNEYDAYADRAYVMLVEQASTAEIEAYLNDIAANHMGLGMQRRLLELSKTTAQILVDLRPEFDLH